MFLCHLVPWSPVDIHGNFFTEIVPGIEPLRRGEGPSPRRRGSIPGRGLNAREVAKYSNFGCIEGYISETGGKSVLTRMWANAQRDSRPAEYRWRPLFNASVWLTPTTRVPCSNAAKTRNPLKSPGVPQTNETISAAIVGRSEVHHIMRTCRGDIAA